MPLQHEIYLLWKLCGLSALCCRCEQQGRSVRLFTLASGGLVLTVSLCILSPKLFPGSGLIRSISTSLRSTLSSPCKWKHTTFILLYDSVLLHVCCCHPCCCKWNHFILFSMDVKYSIVYVKYIFKIHLSVDSHLGCFHFLAIVNSVLVNMNVAVPLGY